MSLIIATYLPPWGTEAARAPGYDEDALTMAVEAGRLAMDPGTPVTKIIFVSRELPLLEGGNSAPLLAALRLGRNLEVVEQIGGAPAALDAILSAQLGTLVIGVDAESPAGAAAALITGTNPLALAARVQRSFPQRTRLADGQVFKDDDPRMLRELGVRASLDAAKLPSKPVFIGGLRGKDASAFSAGGLPPLPTFGASSVFFGIAALIDAGLGGLIAGSEQAAFVAANLKPGVGLVRRKEPMAQPPAKRRKSPGADIKISLAAYDRAFESKVGWHAGRCMNCGTLSLPPRFHCLGCGTDGRWELTPLPYTGSIYTSTTVHVPVPSLESPYTLAVVQCDGVDVRALMHVTDVAPGTTTLGERGTLVLRRVAMRSGVPDYGHAFSPDARPAARRAGVQ